MSNNEELMKLENSFALGFDNVSLRPTAIEMVQRTSHKVTDPAAYGKLRDTLTGDLYTSLRIVPLRIWMTRVFFTPGSDFGSDPACKSDDGLVPSRYVQFPVSDNCKTCVNATWGRGGQRPLCNEQRRILFLTKEDQLPYIITVQGSSIKPVNQVMEGLYRRIMSAQARGQNLNLFDYEMDMVPTQITSPKGIYYILSLQNIKLVDNPGQFGPMYLNFINRAKAEGKPMHELVEGEPAEEERAETDEPQATAEL